MNIYFIYNYICLYMFIHVYMYLYSYIKNFLPESGASFCKEPTIVKENFSRIVSTSGTEVNRLLYVILRQVLCISVQKFL